MIISKTIRAFLENLTFGKLITPTGLLQAGFGTRAAIDQTLSRLCRLGMIARIARGVYTKPRATRFGSILPDADAIARAYAKLRGQALQVSGAEALRRFGLTTQMPASAEFLTTGSSRVLHLGQLEVRLLHAPTKKLLLADSLAGLAISAMWFLGRSEAKPNTLTQILMQLPSLELQALLTVKTKLPLWLARPLEQSLGLLL